MLVVIMLVLALLRPVESLRLAGVVGVAALALVVASPSSLSAVDGSFFPTGRDRRRAIEHGDPQCHEPRATRRSRPCLPRLGARAHRRSGLWLATGRQPRELARRRQVLRCARRSVARSLARGRSGRGRCLDRLVLRAREGAAETGEVPDDAGLLSVALVASIVGFIVAMLFIDAFGSPSSRSSRSCWSRSPPTSSGRRRPSTSA